LRFSGGRSSTHSASSERRGFLGRRDSCSGWVRSNQGSSPPKPSSPTKMVDRSMNLGAENSYVCDTMMARCSTRSMFSSQQWCLYASKGAASIEQLRAAARSVLPGRTWSRPHCTDQTLRTPAHRTRRNARRPRAGCRAEARASPTTTANEWATTNFEFVSSKTCPTCPICPCRLGVLLHSRRPSQRASAEPDRAAGPQCAGGRCYTTWAGRALRRPECHWSPLADTPRAVAAD
jgi:hypothetical protein